MWIKRLAGAADKVIVKLSQGLSVIAIVFLLALMLLTVSDVLLRYLFRAPITGSVELTKCFIVVAGFLGVAWCAVKRGHLKVDILVNRLSPRSQAITDSITLLLALTVVPVVSWMLFDHAKQSMLDGSRSFLLHIPEYPFYIVAGVGYALFFLVLLTILAEYITKAVKR